MIDEELDFTVWIIASGHATPPRRIADMDDCAQPFTLVWIIVVS